EDSGLHRDASPFARTHARETRVEARTTCAGPRGSRAAARVHVPAAKRSHPLATGRWWPRSRRRVRAGIAAAMPSASQSDRVDGPLLHGRSPDLRVGVEDSGRGVFPWVPLRAWTVADALARTRLPLRGQCRNGRGAHARAADFTGFPFQPVGG